MISAKSAPSTLFLLAVVFIGAAYWLIGWTTTPRVTLDQAILFRPFGESDYLPQVSALSQLEFGEASVRELAGKGVRSFPFGAVLLHASLVRLLGDPGFVAADMLAFALYGWMLSYFLRNAGMGRGVAEVLTLAVLSGQLDRRAFWYSRFPRPFVTEIVFVALLTILCNLVNDRATRRRAGVWAALGFLGAVLLQSDIYQATNIGLVALFICAYFIVEESAVALKGVAVAGVVAAIVSAPFAYQRLHESTDVVRRLGVFSIGHKIVPIGDRRLVIFALLSILIEAALYYRLRNAGGWPRAALIVTAAATLVATFSGTLTLYLLGQGIQAHHYVEGTWRAMGYAALLSAGWALEDVSAWLYRKAGSQVRLALSVRRAAFAVVVLACCAAAAVSTRALVLIPNTPWRQMVGPDNRYKWSFAELHSELARPEYRGVQVLGTLDPVLANWWEYRHGYLYVPDFFNSTAPDSEIESRLSSLSHLLNVSRDGFAQLLDEANFMARLTGLKYQANQRFTPWPVNDYSPDARRRIASETIDAKWWHIELPVSERARLLDEYSQADRTTEPERRLDAIVLTKNKRRPLFHPEGGNLTLAWANDFFEIWLPRHAPDAAPFGR